MSDPAERLATGAPATDRSGVPGPRPGPIVWDGDDPDSEDTLRFHTALNWTLGEAQNLLIRKHKDYGPTNISRSPGGPLNGLRVRMWDKLARINHLIDSGAEPSNESLRDSFVDLANYSIIALMILDGNWPKGDS